MRPASRRRWGGCGARGVLGQILPFRSGYHSPFLAPYLDAAQASAATTVLDRARLPVWSATTVAPYPADHGEIRDLFVRHLVEPVRFRELTRRLHAEGVRVFVQVGAGSLAGFIDDTLAADEHLAVAGNTPKRSGLDQLRRVAASVWAEGGTPRTDLLPHRRSDAVDLPPPAASVAGSASVAAAPVPEPQPGHEPAPGPGLRAARPGGRTVRLALGAPLVRLGPQPPALLSAPPARAAEPAAFPESLHASLAGHPVLEELEAATAEATGALAEVVARWATASARPVVPTQAVSGDRTRTTVRGMSLETMPYIIDHCFFRQPPGWHDVGDRFPVVPMTGMLEIMIERLGRWPAGASRSRSAMCGRCGGSRSSRRST
jgi:acyl transferase domain-containing protein